MTVYVLELIRSIDDGVFSMEAIGLYSSEKKAIEAITSLPDETDNYVYNIEEFELDANPRNFLDGLADDLKQLMDLGVVDQLVGEDGEFYYTVTEAGEEIVKNLEIEDTDRLNKENARKVFKSILIFPGARKVSVQNAWLLQRL